MITLEYDSWLLHASLFTHRYIAHICANQLTLNPAHAYLHTPDAHTEILVMEETTDWDSDSRFETSSRWVIRK